MLVEVRCKHCGRLLGRINGKAEIKCTRCKTLNAFEITGREAVNHKFAEKRSNTKSAEKP